MRVRRKTLDNNAGVHYMADSMKVVHITLRCALGEGVEQEEGPKRQIVSGVEDHHQGHVPKDPRWARDWDSGIRAKRSSAATQGSPLSH